MSTKNTIKGGEFIIKDTLPSEIFTPEEWTEEQLMIAQMCEDFIEQEVIPVLDRVDAMEEGLMVSLMDKAGELGLLGLSVPEEFGGLAQDFKTTLLEGSVKVNKGTKSTIIKPGEQAQISINNSNSITISKPDLNDVMAWKNGKFAFNNMDLESIMREMSRWYNVEVVYQDRIADRYTVNVSRDVPVSQLFNFIEMSGGVKFDISNNIITVKK